MNSIIDSENKVQKICDEIRRNTLEPALKEAEEIEQHAKKNAEQILIEANAKKQSIIQSAQKEIDQRQKVFENALHIARKRVMEQIKEEIETALFSEEFIQEVQTATKSQEALSHIIDSLLTLLKDGSETEIFIPSKSDAKKVAKGVGHQTIKNLENKIILSDLLQGGVKIKLKEKNLTLDLSDEAIAELIGKYIRKEFRELLFK